ncbi:hypothetical protein [Estrella lausannensis]|uniref:Putative membrane protein n=1 Tax=Estrella lausannensis TaxID=483423 RepID=A0A0H5DQI7_9BACT|nr:hypothetical protein [Estrella lausannensis]CRX38797.1 putative membrane protein [Estrella lausannensis]
MTVFFNTEIKSDSFTENLGNFCLLPVRVLFEGRTLTKIDQVFLEMESLEGSSVIGKVCKVALALIFLVPGVILGTVIKGLSFINFSVRESHHLFNQASSTPGSQRVLIEGETIRFNLLGNPDELNPSVNSFQHGLPYDWIESSITSPKKMNLKGIRPHVVERLFSMRVNYHAIDELDISKTSMVSEQVRKVAELCPNLRSLKLEGLHFNEDTAGYIRVNCQTLDQPSLQEVQKAVGVEV